MGEKPRLPGVPAAPLRAGGANRPELAAMKPHRIDETTEHERFMDLALEAAAQAAAQGESPVGAVVARAGRVLARDHNRREQLHDPTAHAEMLALRAAARALGSWRLLGATLYVTLEPCAMCAGAAVLARVEKLVYGAPDPKGGAVDTLYRIPTDDRLNHRIEVIAGVRAAESARLLSEFFVRRRKK